MSCYLIEKYSPDLKFTDGDTIVALTPMASYELDRRNIGYSILEDYYDEVDFAKENDACFQDQLTWFDDLDTFLFEIFPEAKEKNIKLALNYYFYIINMVDSLVSRCRVVDKFINKLTLADIKYVSEAWDDVLAGSMDDHLLFGKGQSIFSQVVPLFCKKYDLKFERIIIDVHPDNNALRLESGDLVAKVKNILYSSDFIRHLWHTYKTFSLSQKFSRSNEANKHNMFFVKTPGFVKSIIKDAKRNGHSVFYKSGSDIIKQSRGYYKVVKNISVNGSLPLKDKISGSELKERSNIIKWVNERCGVDVSEILLPGILYFINEFCPRFISLVEKYLNFYRENKINFVFTIHRVGVDEFAAISAASIAKKTKSVCLQHGDQAVVFEVVDFSEYMPYNMYFTNNDEMEEYIKYKVKLRGFDTQVFQYPDRFKRLPAVNRRKLKQTHKKTVVYVPCPYQWDNLFLELRVPDTWYFSWHKELVSFFASRDDFDFIWKGLPATDGTCDPIPYLLYDQGYANIKYSGKPFSEWINKADMVLVDYPTTPLYEAAVSGLPVMCLYLDPCWKIRESALELFGKSLQPYTDFKDGIAKIDMFLDSNPEEFVVSMPRSNTSVVDTLKSLEVTN